MVPTTYLGIKIMSTPTIVTIATKLANDRFRLEPYVPTPISKANSNLATDILALFGYDQLSQISPIDTTFKPTDDQLATLFFNNKSAFYKISAQLAHSVGSENAYEYIRRLAHTPPYVPQATYVYRYGANAVQELFAFDYRGELIKDDRIMIDALINEVIHSIRKCYWHQSAFVPF